jgi:aminopeptidase
MTPESTPPVDWTTAIDTAARHLGDVLNHAFEHREEHAAIVVFDTQCELAVTLTEAYRRSLPDATFMDFDRVHKPMILAGFDLLKPDDLVVLVQSTSFRLDAFRIRVELFRRGLKVIEHPHLARMPGPEGLVYIDALAYDPAYYRGVGQALKDRLDRARTCVVESGGERLTFDGGFEDAKLNVGDYRAMKNVGGQYPIGEVFTEARDLDAVNGRVRVSLFGDLSFSVNRPDAPITLVVEHGRVTDVVDSTPEFDRVLDSIRADEGEIRVRELGLGMNRAFTQERRVTDVGAYERMCGVHLSLGSKHAVYNKPDINKKTARQHVDVFVLTDAVRLDDEVVYRDGAWDVHAHE